MGPYTNEYYVCWEYVRSCLYIKNIQNIVVHLLLFVKDLLICCTSEEKIPEIKSELTKCFKIKNQVGVEIDHNDKCNGKILILTQEKRIEHLAEIYNLKDRKLYTAPMDVSLRLESAKDPKIGLNYRTSIGALLYISA